MVVAVINEHGVFAVESERETPIAAYRHRPMTFQIAMQRMQLPSRRFHVVGRPRVVEREQLSAKPFRMVSLDLGFRSRPEEQLNSLVTKAFDHTYSV